MRPIARDSGRLAARSALQQVLGFIRGVVLPNILGPVHYGSLATILTVERYATLVNFGVHTATLYQAPGKLASGSTEEARGVHEVVVSFSIVTGCIAGAALAAWAWWARDRLGSELAIGLMLAGWIVALIPVRGALMIWARVNR